ncbi:MAG: TRAP transporter small permease [Clostridia bacterium]|nr:TRAP transporter small permease [Clostridia bacterium]MBN2882726.1 TRAP transporter small permease [Clostridia bacterium]
MKKIENFVNKAAEIFNLAAGASIVIAMLLVVINVILRRVFGRPLLGVYEFTGFLSVIIISFGLAYVLVVNAHIAVDFIIEKFKPTARGIIDTITGITATGFMSLFTWNVFGYAIKAMNNNQLSPTTQTPFYIFIFIMAVCFALLCLVYVIKIKESIGKARLK